MKTSSYILHREKVLSFRMNSIEAKEEYMETKRPEDWSQVVKRIPELSSAEDRIPIGYLVWTRMSHKEPYVHEVVRALMARNIHYLRTGLSWAEWVTPEGREWISWYMREYAKWFTVLPCLTFTPPHLALRPSVNAPPQDPSTYARFVDDVLDELGGLFSEIELWNEWNINTDWDPELDPQHIIFTEMIMKAARTVRAHGKVAVLGGPSKINNSSLETLSFLSRRGMSETIDILGFHNLRGTWSDHVPSPPFSEQAESIRTAWKKEVPIWLTEYGFPVIDPEGRFDLALFEDVQVALFAYAAYACINGDVSRAYWYTYKDEVHPSLRFATTGWEDVLQFYFGDTREDGTQRKLAQLLCRGGPKYVLNYAAREGLLPLVDKASLKRRIPI